MSQLKVLDQVLQKQKRDVTTMLIAVGQCQNQSIVQVSRWKASKPIEIRCQSYEDTSAFDYYLLAEFRTPSNEATVISEISAAAKAEGAFVVAPGEE